MNIYAPHVLLLFQYIGVFMGKVYHVKQKIIEPSCRLLSIKLLHYEVDIVNYILFLSIFLTSFRQTIADFLNHYMRPVEPIFPEEVRKWFLIFGLNLPTARHLPELGYYNFCFAVN